MSAASKDRSHRALVWAVAPFVAIPIAIASFVVGRPGITALLIGVMYGSVYLPGFMAGVTERSTGMIPGVATNSAFFRRSVTLEGGWARLSTGRYLIAAAVLIVGGLIETVEPGWAARLYADGPGWALTLVLVGTLLAMTAVVTLAPAVDAGPIPLWGRLVSLVANLVGLVISLALIAAGIVELVTPGALAATIRDLNPLG